MQGTAAVVLAAALCAVRATGTRMSDQTVVIHGAGTAGIGIADVLRQVMISDGLSPAEATSRFWALDRKGLLTSDYAGTMRDYQDRHARPAAEVASWRRDAEGGIGLAEVVARSRPTMLIGTSTQPGVFSEAIVTEMAAHVARPLGSGSESPSPGPAGSATGCWPPRPARWPACPTPPRRARPSCLR
jgi:malate dehydrogenase (oxaloacetate-decarboxylating)